MEPRGCNRWQPVANRSVRMPQALLPSLGHAVRVYVEVGDLAQARPLGKEFVEAFPADGPDWMLVEFAWGANAVDRGEDLRRLLEQTLFVTPYGDAAAALVEGDFARVAETYHEIGEPELEGVARLRAAAQLVAAGRPGDGAAFVEPAVAFFRSVGATRYLNEAERLSSAQASGS
jgi:hypothetical protein